MSPLRIVPIAAALLLATPAGAQYSAQRIASGLESPVYATSPPGDPRLFIVEQTGRIRIHDGSVLLAPPFLDLSGSVSGGSEQGLLGLAFPPDFATSQLFYVNYTNLAGDTVVARYRVSATDPDVADPVADPAFVLVIDQPFSNHNGGHIAFGPNDGLLYIGMGDGGSGGDPLGHGQNPATLLGKMLRIDVSGGFGSNYSIPAGNPLADGPGGNADEIWALGLRNPYRWSFDRQTGDLYIGDVGQGAVEEIDFQPASSAGGENYGWNVMEGSRCYSPPAGCDSTGLTLPVIEHIHALEGVMAIIGGYRYRGPTDPALDGRYFYGDYSGKLYMATEGSPGAFTPQLITAAPDQGSIDAPSGFGEDASGNLHIVDLDGEVFRLGASTPPVPEQCAPVPTGGCDEGAQLSLLLVRDKDEDGPGAGDRVVYRWVRGPAHVQSDFGDPTDGGSGAVSTCVYENGDFLMELSAAEGAANWSALSSRGYRYLDRDGTLEGDGILRLIASGGSAGSSKLILVGKDANLPIPPLPRPEGATYVVEVHNPDNANCVGTTFTPADVQSNEDKLLKLKR
jgi:glucose/arabinose dehydrogenase